MTHECYAVVSGGSLLRVGARGRGVGEGEEEGEEAGKPGREEYDDGEGGVQVEVAVGDVIVLPVSVNYLFPYV